MLRLAVIVALALLAPGVAFAQPDPLAPAREALERGDLPRAREALAPWLGASDTRTAARAQFMLGAVEERDLRFPDALRAYRTSYEMDPGGRYGARAHARIDYLGSHGEGGFAPLAALESVRTDPQRSSDPAVIDGLARASRTFPPGLVRAESRLLVGQAYAGRLHRPRDAAPVLHELAADPTTPVDMRQLALDLLAHVREETGELSTGVSELRQLGAPSEVVARLREQLRRAVGYRIALAWIGLLAIVFVVSMARVVMAQRFRELTRAWLRPLPLAHIALLSLGGAFLAHEQDSHSMTPFFAFGLGALVVYLAASAWNLVGSSSALPRVVRAVTCAIGMLAVSFLAMYRFDPDMLTGIGL